MHVHFPMTISLKGGDDEKYLPVPLFQGKISTGISAGFNKARAQKTACVQTHGYPPPRCISYSWYF